LQTRPQPSALPSTQRTYICKLVNSKNIPSERARNYFQPAMHVIELEIRSSIPIFKKKASAHVV
jgi:hypothetical protein